MKVLKFFDQLFEYLAFLMGGCCPPATAILQAHTFLTGEPHG
jgi:hypothetical protein